MSINDKVSDGTTGWEIAKLADCIAHQKGYAFKSEWYSSNGVPVVRVSNFTDNSIDCSSLLHIPTHIALDYAKYELKRRDIIVQTVGSWPSNPSSVVGKCVRVPALAHGALLNQNAVKIIPSSEINGDFLYYLLKSEYFSQYIVGTAQGAASQAAITLDAIKAFSFLLPPRTIQEKIGALLSAYDDLIMVNRQRIAVLEEMARGLFEEWFVRFRFPGHEAVPILDTPDGPLPEGWLYDTLGNVSAINAASLKPANAPSEIGYIDISSVSPGRIDAINRMPFVEAPGRARRLVTDGSILWSNVRPNRRAFAVVLDPTEEIVASTGFTVLDARETSFAYLYHWVTTENFVGYLVGNAQGAAYPAVTAATFERAAILLPPFVLIKRFTDIAEPMLRLADGLRKTNVSLAASRDLLLPRLISGQLSLTQAERKLEKAA